MFASRLLALLLVAVVPACSILDSDTSESDVEASPFWKNKLSFPNEPFANANGPGQPRWVKFSILTSEPTKVYFQDSKKYPFHYEFAKSHLPDFTGMTTAEFARASLEKDGQKVIVGAVLMPPRLETMEYGIQLLREDAYTKEDVKRLHDLVKSNIVVDGGGTARAFYMPSFEQNAAAQRDEAWLRSQNITIGSPDRWLTGDACYARGWAFGKAKFIAGADIKAAYLDGRLKTDDILVTDGVPSEVPYVAGIVSLAPSTPSSHVAILSQTWGIPFVFPASQTERDSIRALATGEKEIALRTEGDNDGDSAYCRVAVIQPEGTIDAATRAYLAELRRPPPVEVPARTHLGALTKAAVQLQPGDVKYFGGKASNFGTLNRTIPQNSPKALGISFDLWEAFLAQTLPSGQTLEQEVNARLGSLSFPPALGALETKLEEIRKLVTDTARLPDAERTKLFAALQAFGFDPKIKIRFRSSTNVEDGEVLSGAGLYDSFSGCLADDLDGDTNGPSLCDGTEDKERGVERAIKKVFASFYNTNAVLERLKYRIPESNVGMALAAHYSFPDETEAANGVATAHLYSYGTIVQLVSQPGAESVTNPDGSATPESVNVEIYGPGDDSMTTTFRQSSSIAQLGAKVMTWDDDYRTLGRLIEKASQAFKADHALGGDEIALDVEYKKDTDGKLILKQIRLIPQRSRTPSVVPVLFSESQRFCIEQGEFGSVFGNHRIKTQGALSVRNAKLDDIATSLVTKLDFDMIDSGARSKRTGAPATFTGARHEVEGGYVRDFWDSAAGTMMLQTEPKKLVAPADIPLFVARDFRWMFEIKYSTPRPSVGWEGLGDTSSDIVSLAPCIGASDVREELQTIEANGPNGLHVKTRFRYRTPQGQYEKTASLGKWEETEIRGLVSQPIVLKGWYSQTFHPQHHNFNEDFMFEPALEENLPPGVAQELAAKDIQALVMMNAGQGSPEGVSFYVLKKSSQKLEGL